MAKKSIAQLQREIRKAKEREANKLAKHLELMGAAYCQATDIPPTEVTLLSEKVDDNTRRYWYARFDTPPNLNECHPDIRSLFELAIDINRAKEEKNDTAVAQGVDLLCALVNRVGKEATSDDLRAVREAQAKAEAKQDAADNGQDGGEVRISGQQ